MYETPVALCEAAARRVADPANAAVAARGRCCVALSGGSTPQALYELLASDRLVAAVFVQAVGMFRITMTVPLLNAARLQMFLVAGSSKAAVLRQVLADKGDPGQLPARLMRPAHGAQLWLVDRAAAHESAADAT